MSEIKITQEALQRFADESDENCPSAPSKDWAEYRHILRVNIVVINVCIVLLVLTMFVALYSEIKKPNGKVYSTMPNGNVEEIEVKR